MFLGSWNPEFTICLFRARKCPFQAPTTLRFQGKVANFKGKHATKLGKKKRQKDKWLHFTHVQGGGVYMGKTGTIWLFFRALFPSTWRTLSPDALFTRIWDTRKPRICHIFVLSLLVSRSTLPRNAYFSW